MNLTSPSQVRSLLHALGCKPNRTLGQNFLIDRNTLTIFVGLADLEASDRVLEVGPGLGVVTEALLDQAGSVVAVERDHLLYRHLGDRFSAEPRLTLHRADMLDLDPADLSFNKVVSALPYVAGTRIVVELATHTLRPDCMVVTVQQEVGERITASPGASAYGMLSVWLQLDYATELVRSISPSCFWPRPEVKSAMVRMVRRPAPLALPEHRERLYAVTKSAFTYRRKQLVTFLSQTYGKGWLKKEEAGRFLEGLGLSPRARPQELGVEHWCRLTAWLAEKEKQNG